LNIIFFLILFPLLAAVLLLLVKSDGARGVVVVAASAAIAAASVFLAVLYFTGGGNKTFSMGEGMEEAAEFIGYAMMAIEIVLAVIIFVLGFRHKKYLASLLTLIQAPLIVWFEMSAGKGVHVATYLYYDQLSVIMALIIGIIGTLICVYSLGYMKDFQHHHHDQPDRRPWFFFLLFLFLAAMYGIVFSNNIMWLYFFWEITTLCSFFLIGFTKTKEAVNNSFRALIMNLLGGVAFVLAIIYMGTNGAHPTLELDQLRTLGALTSAAIVPVMLLSFAGITKAAQMPFNSWLLGAMVAPTPTSALLHSSTMVKAGVFLILKLSPLLSGNMAGMMVTMVGGVTFLMASFAAISQSNAKRVLAYSTVANLGLIVACAGAGTPGAIWAAVMLIIFHAVTKSLLFLCVGTAEHNIGSRDIEDMDGLFGRMPTLAGLMIVGVSAMFLAPFGMLVSKWAALESVIFSGNPLLPLFIIFGSSATLFYWGKWLGKLVAIVARRDNIERRVNKSEWASLLTLAFLTVCACLTITSVSNNIVAPYIMQVVYQGADQMALSAMLMSKENLVIISCLVAFIVILPILFFGKTKSKILPIYLSGAGKGDNLTYEGAMEKDTAFAHRNWYMDSYFNERRMNIIGVAVTIGVMAIIFILTFGGVVS
jgi:ech hydrogenase subunit A